MKFQSVLIVTYGRSGSTLLQGILNSIPGCLIRGENFNVCLGLYQSYTAYLQTITHEQASNTNSDTPSSPWYGALHLDADQYLADMRTMVLSHLQRGISSGTQIQCVGFKEIRYLPLDMHEGKGAYVQYLHGYLDFLAKLLPNVAFVFLTREHSQVVKSAWWKTRSPETVLGKLQQFEKAAKAYAHQHDNCHFIDYSDMVRNDEELASLFSFLGAPYDHASVAEVLKQRHSYGITATSAGTAAAPAAAPAATSKMVLKIHDKPAGVPVVKIDPPPRQQLQRRVVQLGGVVVALGEGQRALVLRDDQGHGLPVKWGLPSPVVGKEMPDVAQAQTARFRCDEVPVVGGMTYHLVLCDKRNGQEYRLASLSIRVDGPVATPVSSEPLPHSVPAGAAVLPSAAAPTPTPAPTKSVAAPTSPAAAATPTVAAGGTPVRPFIIWTLQRTGGTNLAQALFTSSGGQGLHEPFNADRVYADVNKRWSQTQDAAALAKALDEICDTGVRIKHCVEMVAPELNVALARAAQQRGYGHVFLFRRRSVDRLLSLHFAQKTGIWGKKVRGKTDPNKALSEPIPVEKLIAHQRRCDQQLTIVYQELLALGAKPMLVAFEDVYMTPGEEPRQRISQLLDNLGIELQGREQFIHNVLTGGDQGTRGKYDLFPRRNELEEKCNQLPGFAPQQPLEVEA